MSLPAEVLSVGGTRRPLRPPRPPRAVMLAVLVLVAGVAGWQLLPAEPHAKPAATPISKPVAAQTPASSVASTVADHLVLAERTGAKLAMGGDSLVDVGLDDGFVRWTSLPGTTLESVHVRSGDVVLVWSPGDRLPTAVYVPADRSRVVELGAARALVPAADDGHVWLAEKANAVGALWRVDLTGRVVRKVSLGDRRRGVRETPYGMITESFENFSSSLERWDLDARQVVQIYWTAANFLVVAADAEHTAFTLPNCDLPACPMKVAVDKTGEILDVGVPTGWATGAASFSPDSSRLAVVGRRIPRAGEDEPYLLVADLATGAVRQVGGLEPGTPRAALLTWSPDSRWFFAASERPAVNLLGYRLGDKRVRYASDPMLRQMQPADIRSMSAY
ncbi:MAG: hypothetical protein ABI912_00305 [Actinomycetota bacterium]